ncbi:MAG: hypothetical protein E6R03_02295 [Hyphomicrobiaceae bacterium]|nr:MAG: hypothetical protein E6R03_02295 [Hyphomicrobiaceae bacterium]
MPNFKVFCRVGHPNVPSEKWVRKDLNCFGSDLGHAIEMLPVTPGEKKQLKKKYWSRATYTDLGHERYLEIRLERKPK